MIFLAVSHFMSQDEGDFVFVVVQGLKEADVDAHVVADGTEGVEGRVVVDKIIVRLIQDGRVDGRNGTGQVFHDAGRHGVGLRVVIDAVLGLDLLHEFVAPFIVQIAELLIQAGVLYAGSDDRADGAEVNGLDWRGRGDGGAEADADGGAYGRSFP